MPRPKKPDQDGKEVKKRSRNGCWLVHFLEPNGTNTYLYIVAGLASLEKSNGNLTALAASNAPRADKFSAEKKSPLAPTVNDRAKPATIASV